jgi:hypothetical protein
LLRGVRALQEMRVQQPVLTTAGVGPCSTPSSRVCYPAW